MVSSTELVTSGRRSENKWKATIMEEGDKRNAVLDSGAQISIIPLEVVEYFGLNTQRLSTPVVVVFGNGSKTLCNYTVYFGVLVGFIFVVPEAKGCFFNLGTFVDNGDRSVIFSAEKVQVVKNGG